MALLSGAFSMVFAQSETEEKIGHKIEELSYTWDEEAEILNNYASLEEFCKKASYRKKIVTLLNDIHHYDTLLYNRLVELSRVSHDREIKKTLEEIHLLEEEYDTKSFLDFLREECRRVKDIEGHSDELKKDIGHNSYDGQIYLVETELNKFIKQITKRVDHVRKHVEHLHIQ